MYNKVILVGHVGKDIEVITFDGGGKIGKFPLAVSRQYKDKNEKWQEETDWFNIVLSGKKLELMTKPITKGELLLIEGELRNRKYEKDGIEMKVTEIFAFAVKRMNPAKEEPFIS